MPNTYGYNPLQSVAKHKHLDAIQILQGNATLHCTNNAGRTPLHQAAFFGRSGVINDLANTRHINQRTNDRFAATALEIAAFRNHFNVVQSLIAKKGHCYFSVSKALSAAILSGNQPIIAALKDRWGCI